MNDLRKIVLFLIGLYFLFRFILFPIIRFIINIFKLSKLKKQIQDFGKEIIRLPRKQKITKKMIYAYCIFCVYCICFGILSKIYITFIGAFIFLPVILDFIIIREYTEYNGIYENGIVVGSFLEYKYLFSWKKINDDKISLLKQDGLRFDLEAKDKQKEIIDFFISKGIPEEQ